MCDTLMTLQLYSEVFGDACQHAPIHACMHEGYIWSGVTTTPLCTDNNMGVDMICNVGGLDDHYARSVRKFSIKLLKMP